jgi:hypothetical protein
VNSRHQVILAGGVCDFDVGSLLTAFGLGRQAIRLEVLDSSGQCDGCIVMKADRVVSAVAGELSGAEAVHRLLAATHPAHFKVFRESHDAVIAQVGIGRVAEFTRRATRAHASSAPRARIRILEGSLADFSITDVMRTVAMARQYSVVDVLDDKGSRAGVVHLKAGQVLWAQAGPLVELPALRELLGVPTTFRFAVFRDSHPVARLRPLGPVADLLLRPSSPALDAVKANASGARTSRPPPPPPPRRALRTDPPRVRVLEGSLSQVDIATLLQAVSTGRQYVEIQILEDGSSVGTIELKAGVLVGARMGTLHGLDAARGLLRSPAHFQFAVYRWSEAPKLMTALSSLTELLLDGDAERDERGHQDHGDMDEEEDTVVTTSTPLPEPSRRAPNRTAVAPAAVMDGNLAEFDIPSVLQVVGTSRQRTSVRVFDDQRQLVGEVHLKGGHVLMAEAPGATGVAAVRRLLHSPRDFTFVVLRHPNTDGVLASIGAIVDVLGDAATLAVPPPVEECVVNSPNPRPVDATRAVASAPRLEPDGRRPYVGWLVSAAVGAGFVLLGAGAATLLVRREHVAPDVSDAVARRVPVEPEPKASRSSEKAVPSAPVGAAEGAAPAAIRSGGAVFGQADPIGPALGRPAIASMQAGLKLLGYDPGPIDGILGTHTSAAIKAFQYAEHLVADGTLSSPTRARLAARVGGL